MPITVFSVKKIHICKKKHKETMSIKHYLLIWVPGEIKTINTAKNTRREQNTCALSY